MNRHQDDPMRTNSKRWLVPPGDPPIDPVAARRNKNGDSEGRTYATQLSTFGDHPIEETGIQEGLEALAEHDIVGLAHYRGLYHRHGILVRQWNRTNEEASERLQVFNESNAPRRAEIDDAIRALEEKQALLDVEADHHRESDEEALVEAHEAAGKAVNSVGGDYRPEAPENTCLPQGAFRPGEVHAADLKLPYLPQDETWLMHPMLKGIATFIAAAIVGVSFMAMVGALEVDTLFSRPDWPALCFAIAVGYCIAAWGGFFVRVMFTFASQKFWQNRVAASIGVYVLAVTILVLVCGIETGIERAGIMKLAAANADINSLSGHASPHESEQPRSLMYLAAMILSVPYMGAQAGVGIIKGRVSALNVIRLAQDSESRAELTELKEKPSYTRAAESLSHVRVIRHRIEERLQNRHRDLAANEGRIGTLQAKRPDYRAELLETDKLRGQDIGDRCCHNQRELDSLFEQLWRAWKSGGSAAPRRSSGITKRVRDGWQGLTGRRS